MKIERVTYSKKFPYAPYLNFDIGFDASLEDGENPLEAMGKLDAMAEQYYNEKYPQPSLEDAVKMMNDTPIQFYQSQQSEEKIPVTNLVERYITEIEQYTDIDKLRTEWNLLAKSNPKLKAAYDNQINKLTG